MNTLLILKDADVFPGAHNNNPATFSVRYAARAVVLNSKGQVALLNVAKGAYHKLPGGGVEEAEDTHLALRRELREEVGCNARIVQEVGEIIEYKNEHREKQISRCWLVEQTGSAAPPTFTEEELADGFSIEWAESIDQAIAIMEQDKPTDYTGMFIRQRDACFLKAAKALI